MNLLPILLLIVFMILLFLLAFYIKKIDKFTPEIQQNSEKDNLVEKWSKEIDQDKLKWLEFKDLNNADEVLTAKAAKLAEELIAFAYSYSKLSQSIKTNNIIETVNILFFELLVLFLHATDRISFSLLGVEKRSLFMDCLMENVILIIKKAYGVEAEKVVEAFTKTYNERQVEYTSFRLPENNEQSLGGTLFWEFGKKIAGKVGRPFPEDPELMLQVTMMTQAALAHLNISELLKNYEESLDEKQND